LLDGLLARCSFPPPGSPVVCAVSGGADSTALVALACAAGCVVEVVHVDHRLRASSATDAEVVHATSVRLGVPCRVEVVAVEPGPNLEARARRARYAALPAGALLGHTADDQAETVLLQLVRGAGVHGLAGMAPDGRRPLLELRRHETRALCERLGLRVVDDETNAEPAFRRNRVRHEVLPLLADVAGRDVVPLLARTARHARAAADALDEHAGHVDPTDAAAVLAAPPAVAAVALRAWLRRCSDDGQPPTTAVIERVRTVAAGQARSTEVGGGWRVRRHRGRLLLDPPPVGDGVGGPE
jgi:tRNA(Ile)-lysidine synthase